MEPMFFSRRKHHQEVRQQRLQGFLNGLYASDTDIAMAHQQGWLAGFNAAAEVEDETFLMHEELLRDGFWSEEDADFYGDPVCDNPDCCPQEENQCH